MKLKNRKLLLVVLTLVIVEMTSLFLMYNSLANKKVDLSEVNLKNNFDEGMFAILLEQEDGTYLESNDWPPDAKLFVYNQETSGCMDINGLKLNGVLSYSDGIATIEASNTVNCYLYFDINPIKYVNLNNLGYAKLPNSNGENLLNYKIYGNSVQNGTPSPETPVEIQSVGDYDETTGKYVIPISVSGKNIFDTNSFELGYTFVGSGVGGAIAKKVDPTAAVNMHFDLFRNTTYTFSINSDEYWISRIAEMDSNDLCTANHSFYHNTDIRSKYTFTPKENTIYMGIIVRRVDGVDLTEEDLEKIKFQLEISDTLTEYEPYVGSITNIYLDEPLRKVGNYSDYIDLNEKTLYRVIKESKINDNNLLEKYSEVTDYSAFMMLNNDLVDNISGNVEQVPLLSNLFVYNPCGSANSNDVWSNAYQICSFNYPTYKRINFTLPNTVTDVASAKEWLQSNPIDYLYPSATPESITIDLPNITTMDGNSMVIVNTTVVPSAIELIYDTE